MKKILLLLSLIVFITCGKEDIPDQNGDKDEWEAPSVTTATLVMKLAINEVNSETKSMGMSTYKKWIEDIGDRFTKAVTEVEKKADSSKEFKENINKAIGYVNENVEKSEGKKGGFTDKQNESLNKYHAYSVTSLDELKKLLK